MANFKAGLAYYNVDTDRYQDMRIKRLKKDFRCPGIAVYDYILCEIYRVRGCFTVWDDSTIFDVAEYFGLKENAVKEIVKYCGAVGLFDKELLSRGIITSSSIQKRYLEMCNRAKRKLYSIPDDINLIGNIEIQEESNEITEELIKLPEESKIIPNYSGSLPQSKVKNSKVIELPKGNMSVSVYIDSFNSIRGTKFKATDKVRKQFNARLKEGYTADDMISALKTAMTDKYHIGEGFKYLTPEFFTRSDKLEKFINMQLSNETPKESNEDFASRILNGLKKEPK